LTDLELGFAGVGDRFEVIVYRVEAGSFDDGSIVTARGYLYESENRLVP